MNGKYERKVTTLLGNYDIFWNINADTIELALRVKTTGWVGFGIGEQTTGGMGGADIVTVQVWPNGTAAAVDRFSLGNEAPLADTCQDWTLVSASEANGVTTVELRRALSTGDAQDHPLGVNKQLRTKVLVAHGASDDLAYHAANRYALQVDFFGEAASSLDLDAFANDPTNDYFDVTSNNVVIPLDGICITGADCYDGKTTYYETCRDVSELRDVSITGFTALIDGGEDYNPELHHFVVWGHDSPNCGSGQGDFVFGWAPGAKEIVLPKDVGIRLGPGGTQSFRLQTHYDNPTFKRNKHDSSGVRFFYKKVQTKYETGVIVLGDLYMALDGQRLPDGFSQYDMSCSDLFEKCEEAEKGPITVFFSQLHMHKAGLRMNVQRRRPDGELETVIQGEFFNFGFQDANYVSYTMNPGEEWIVSCFYENNRKVKWGLGSNDEMCQNFVGYYPRKSCLGPACGLGSAGGKLLQQKELRSIVDLNRTFGRRTSPKCAALPPTKPAGSSGQALVAAKPAVSSGHSTHSACPLVGLAATAVLVRLLRL